MKINGLMIDASRLLEPHAYYYRLVEFMAGWKMNTLLFHFSDDFGCALRLPGFPHLAMPGAFTMPQLKKLVAFAHSRGIDVIPELETFGHTRYITDHPRYQHLFAGKRTRSLKFNAVDPLHPETHTLMQRLISAVAKVFPSPYLHLGCDEVDLQAYCSRKGLDADELWADYVNRMIGFARDAGKTPMIWADHVSQNGAIARRLQKDVVLVDWRYEDTVRDTVTARLKKSGFGKLVAAPALAWFKHRFLPPEAALENTARMSAFAKRHKALGVINTVWCPWRYVQNAMYYGIAYSACAAREGGRPDMQKFNWRFARNVFGTALIPELESFLEAWPQLAIDNVLSRRVVQRRPVFTREELRRLRAVNRAGLQALRAAPGYVPRTNQDIWRGMVLAAQCAWLCSEGLLLRRAASPGAARKARYNELLRQVRCEMDAEWDRTRYPDDIQKLKTLFPGYAYAYAMLLMKRLPLVR